MKFRNSLVASTAALIVVGWSEPVPGRVYLSLWILNPKPLTPFLSKNIIPFLGFRSAARNP